MKTAFAPLCLALVVIAATARADERPSRRDVDLTVATGVVLKATLFDPGVPGPGVLLMHMCDGRGRGAWDGVAQSLAAAGLHVLTFNYRGVEGSGGDPLPRMGLELTRPYWKTQWAADRAAALALLRSRPGVAEGGIALGGASCGVFNAVETAREHPQGIKALAVIAGPYGEGARELLAASPQLRFLAAASLEDELGTQWMRELFGASTHPAASILVYEDAGHGTHILESRPELADVLKRFFVTALRPAPRP
jgi:dienelactone hydrolase